MPLADNGRLLDHTYVHVYKLQVYRTVCANGHFAVSTSGKRIECFFHMHILKEVLIKRVLKFIEMTAFNSPVMH